jgi:hypothetical protein
MQDVSNGMFFQFFDVACLDGRNIIVLSIFITPGQFLFTIGETKLSVGLSLPFLAILPAKEPACRQGPYATSGVSKFAQGNKKRLSTLETWQVRFEWQGRVQIP